MDLVTLAMAKKYTDEKAGYVETTAPITFDGDETGKEVLSTNEGKFVTIGKVDGLDLNTVASVTLRSRLYDDAFVLEKQHMTVQTVENTQGLRYTNAELEIEGLLLALIVNGYLAVLSDLNDTDYVARIEFAETVHTIDPKFLPPMGGEEKIIVELPMEYDYLFFGEIELDAETGAKLVRAAENLQPVYLKCLSGGATVVRKCEISLMGSGMYFFECFNVWRGSVFADTLTYNANAGTLLGVSYTLSIASTTGGADG